MLAQFPGHSPCIVLARSACRCCCCCLCFFSCCCCSSCSCFKCFFFALCSAGTCSFSTCFPCCHFAQRQLLTFNDAALYFNTLCLPGCRSLPLLPLLPPHPLPLPFSHASLRLLLLPSPPPTDSTCHKQRFEKLLSRHATWPTPAQPTPPTLSSLPLPPSSLYSLARPAAPNSSCFLLFAALSCLLSSNFLPACQGVCSNLCHPKKEKQGE